MRHRDLKLNHVIENWTFVDSSARLNLAGAAAEDVGKIGFQQSDSSYWRLMNFSPVVWVSIANVNREFGSPWGIMQRAYTFDGTLHGWLGTLTGGGAATPTNPSGVRLQLAYAETQLSQPVLSLLKMGNFTLTVIQTEQEKRLCSFVCRMQTITTCCNYCVMDNKHYNFTKRWEEF